MVAFVLGLCSTLLSQTVVKGITVVAIAFAVLLAVIAVGIVFDIVGVAVAAAQAAPLHSRAASAVRGAKEALVLIRNAHQVASFCNDVVGDVSGTLSGAIGITIVYQIVNASASAGEVVWGTTVMTAAVASLVVGGKAFGKVYAIRYGTEIIFRVGQVIAFCQRVLHIRLIPQRW